MPDQHQSWNVMNKNYFVISVSPNGKELVSLDILKNTLQTWDLVDNKLILTTHLWEHGYHIFPTTNPSWSIAISDRDKNNNMFIALSRVRDEDIQVKENENGRKVKEEGSFSVIPEQHNNPGFLQNQTHTYPIDLSSTHLYNPPVNSMYSPSGSMHYHHSSVGSTSTYTHHTYSSSESNTYYDYSNHTASIAINNHDKHDIIIIHVKKSDKKTNIIESSGIESGIVKFIDSNTLIILRGNKFTRIVFDDKILNNKFYPESFEYQISMIHELEMRSLKSSKALLNSTIVKNYFFLCKSNQHHNIFEMYDLHNNNFELKHVFHARKIGGIDHLGYGGVRTPLYAISENGKLLAVSLCKKVVAIFLIENSLMVAIHDFCNKSNSDYSTLFTTGAITNNKSAKILDMKFYDNDEKLMVLTQEQDDVYTTIWDLFNCNIHNPYIAHLDPSIRQSLEEPIDYGMRKCKRHEGRPLGIFSNYLVYPSHLIKGNDGVDLIPFDQKKISKDKYKIIINNNGWYGHKIFDHNGTELYNHHDLIIEDSEPWNNSDNKSQIVVWLNDKKTIQLIIGNETIQVWEQNKKLVYIWAPLLSRSNYFDTPASKDKSSIDSTDSSLSIGCKIQKFILKKFTAHQYQYKIEFSFGHREFSKHLPREKDYIKSACNAIEFLQWQMKYIKNLDNKLRRYLSKTIQETRLLIKKFIDEQPQTWKLLDIKECTMSHLVAAGCDDLISYIVDENRHLMLHNPRRYAWSKREIKDCKRLIKDKKKILNREIPYVPQERTISDNDDLRKPSDLKIAIDCTNKNAVKGLVKYYSALAMDNTGWMFTVSDELLELLKYNSDYVVDLFYQPIFGAKEAPHLDKASIMSEISLPGSKNSLRSLHDIPTKLNKSPNTINDKLLDLQNSAPWVMTCMVPLPDFTIPKDKCDETSLSSKQSSFIQMVISSSNDNMDFIFDNPAMEAIVNYKWCAYAKKIIYFLLGLYGFYQLCFTYLCYVYIAHLSSNNWKWNFFYPFICWVLIFGVFLLICEFNQGLLLKKNYLRIYNLFDLLSGILPLLSTSLLLKFAYSEWEKGNNGFENIKTDPTVLILLSVTMLTLWIELLMRMRSLQIIGEYVFIIINLSKRIAPFLGTMLVIICGLAHSMFILLSHPNNIDLVPNLTSYTLFNPVTQENFILTQNIDVNSPDDNLFADFFTSIKAVYFWINGQWDQINQWNFWPVDGLSIFGSLFLVIIMQNILIALMSDVVDEAKEIGKRAFLKLRAELIAEVEVFFLTKNQLQDKDLFPRHIYYIINCDEANRWLEKCKRKKNGGYFNYGERTVHEKGHELWSKIKGEECFKKGEKVFKMGKNHEDKKENMSEREINYIVPFVNNDFGLNSNSCNKSTNRNYSINSDNNIIIDNNINNENNDNIDPSENIDRLAEIEKNIKLLLELSRKNS
ncbi:hypothetical protein C1645_871584 [Glomus cerebriforme]|uniref:Ion transport domain-containing protein n=1 Tax=Glomus cerebriforme TaxID=658196 RepID=A0A397TFQ8_9GLOM|nr:hypothetical protein C1645_871584 [Glomus cerebriforme]